MTQEIPTLPVVAGNAFVFGSAPNPVVSRELLHDSKIVTANASQVSLEAYGVEKPYITFMRSNMHEERDVDTNTLEALRGRCTEILIVISDNLSYLEQQLRCLSGINYQYDEMFFVNKSQ